MLRRAECGCGTVHNDFHRVGCLLLLRYLMSFLADGGECREEVLIDHGMIRPPGPRIGQRRVLQEAVVLDHRIVPHNSMGINVRPTASSSDIGQNEKEAMPSVRMLDRCRRTQSHRVRNVIQGTH